MCKFVKIISLILSCVMLLTLVSCGPAGGMTSDSPLDASSAPEQSNDLPVPSTDGTGELSNVDPSSTSSSVSTSASSSSTGKTSSSKIQSTTSTSATTKPITSNGYDKPSDPLLVYKVEPVKSTIDKEATAMRNSVLNAKCATPPSTGTKWYISNKGNDNNDGKSPATALATTKPLKYRIKTKAGDSILFECGGVYYGVSIAVQSDMFIGSYGNGAKPCLYAATENSANAKWTKESGDIWKLETLIKSSDVGTVVFNHGEKYASRKFKKSDLKNNLDFYFANSYIYLKCDKNPAQAFKSIIVTPGNAIITIKGETSNVTIDNLTLKYSGSFAISFESVAGKGSTIRNCEIAWIGGIIKSGELRYGNGIEWWNGCEDALVENCWVYQIYDSGISPQGNSVHVEKNITIRNNLIEYCGYASYEYWVHPVANASIENMLVDGNIMRFSGCGFGTDGRDASAPHIRSNSNLDNKCTNFIISNNIFEYSKENGLVYCRSNVGTLPILSGNRYIQPAEYYVGAYGGAMVAARNTENGQKTVTKIFKDATGIFELYK